MCIYLYVICSNYRWAVLSLRVRQTCMIESSHIHFCAAPSVALLPRHYSCIRCPFTLTAQILSCFGLWLKSQAFQSCKRLWCAPAPLLRLLLLILYVSGVHLIPGWPMRIQTSSRPIPGVAVAAQGGEAFITVADANAVLRDMVQAQVAAFNLQQQVIEALIAETLSLIDQLHIDADISLRQNKAAAEAYVVEQVGARRTQTEIAVNDVESKLQEMHDLILNHDAAQSKTADENKIRHRQLEEFSEGVQKSIQHTQQEVNRTQYAIQALIHSTRSDGSSSVLRPGSGQLRDRQVFDPPRL